MIVVMEGYDGGERGVFDEMIVVVGKNDHE
jgi:hypothetical protein